MEMTQLKDAVKNVVDVTELDDYEKEFIKYITWNGNVV